MQYNHGSGRWQTLALTGALLAASPALAQDDALVEAQAPEAVEGAVDDSPTSQASTEVEDSAALDAILTQMFSGQSQTQGVELQAAIATASAYPLGTRENPVRAHMPPGQREYLSRLRCSDLSRPSFRRLGSAGASPYGNIVDIYQVECKGAEPAKSSIFIDMYHEGHVETEPVPGFGIIGGMIGGIIGGRDAD